MNNVTDYFSNPFKPAKEKPAETTISNPDDDAKPEGGGVQVDFSVMRDENYNLFLKTPPKIYPIAKFYIEQNDKFIPILGINSDKTGALKKKINESIKNSNLNDETKKDATEISELADTDLSNILSKFKTSFTKTDAYILLYGLKRAEPNEAEKEKYKDIIGRIKGQDEKLEPWLSSTLFNEVKDLADAKKDILNNYYKSRAGQIALNAGRGLFAYGVAAPVALGLGTVGALTGATAYGLGKLGQGAVGLGKEVARSSTERYNAVNQAKDLTDVIDSAIASTLNQNFKNALSEVKEFINDPNTQKDGKYFTVTPTAVSGTLNDKVTNGSKVKINFKDEIEMGIGSKLRRMRTNLQYAIKLNKDNQPMWNLKSGFGLYNATWTDPVEFIKDISMRSDRDPKALSGSNMMGVTLKAFQGGKTRKHKKSKTQKGGRRHKKTRKH